MDEHAAPGTERREDFGKLQYGCEHHKRRCKIRAPCCNQIFPCRHCHNDAMSSSNNPRGPHELVRRDVKQVICSICDTEQEVAKVCSNCGINMGEYYCEICKFSMMILIKDNSIAMNVGFAGLVIVMSSFTVRNVALAIQYRCPICLKTIFDMSQSWEHLDQEIEAVPMPEEYNFEVSILCNDCNTTSTVPNHIFGHMCRHCSSYNTRRISTPEHQ